MEVRRTLPPTQEWIDSGIPRSVLYIAPKPAPSSGGHHGRSVAKDHSLATINVLKSTPSIVATVISVGEGHTSSVCSDPLCRGGYVFPSHC